MFSGTRVSVFLALCVVLLAVFTASAVSLPNALAGIKTTYETLKEGQGDVLVTKGARVTVHATGVVKQTGKKFWSTKDAGQRPFEYQAGIGGVITGW
jgi:hypothetical protein